MTWLYDASAYDARLTHEVVEWQARRNGFRVFLRQDERRVTFADTANMMRRYSDGLRSLGLRKGEVVAMVMAPVRTSCWRAWHGSARWHLHDAEYRVPS